MNSLYLSSSRRASFPVVLSFLLLVCGLAACQETTVEPTDAVNFSGRVIDAETSRPVADALVTLNPSLSSAITDSAGRFVLSNVSLGVESYTLNVTLDGYRRYVQSIATSGIEDDVSLIVSLEPTIVSERAPTRPYAPTPVNGAAGIDRDVTLRWRSDDDTPEQLRFDVYLADGEGVTRVARTIRDTFFALSGLGFGESYTWQVTAYDGTRDTVFGPIWAFSTEPQPGYPLAFTRNVNGNPGIYSGALDVNAEDYFRITSPDVRAFRPVWSPTGEDIAYLQYVGTDIYLYVASANGENARVLYPVPLIDIDPETYRFDWTADGFGVVFGYLDRLLRVDVSTGRTTALIQIGDGRLVQEVSASPDGITFAINAVSRDRLVTDILRLRPSTGEVDTIVQDTIGLISGIDFSPSGNELLVSIDRSGRELPNRRQFEATLFEFDLVRKTRRIVTGTKPAGVNDLQGTYSRDGGFIYFTRGSNVIGVLPDIYRVLRSVTTGTNFELTRVISEASGPTLR